MCSGLSKNNNNNKCFAQPEVYGNRQLCLQIAIGSGKRELNYKDSVFFSYVITSITKGAAR